jgi:hypothetical protein
MNVIKPFDQSSNVHLPYVQKKNDPGAFQISTSLFLNVLPSKPFVDETVADQRHDESQHGNQ